MVDGAVADWEDDALSISADLLYRLGKIEQGYEILSGKKGNEQFLRRVAGSLSELLAESKDLTRLLEWMVREERDDESHPLKQVRYRISKLAEAVISCAEAYVAKYENERAEILKVPPLV